MNFVPYVTWNLQTNSCGIKFYGKESSFGINSLSRFSESTVRILEILENVAGRTKSTTFATLTLLHSLKKLEAAESVGGREGEGGEESTVVAPLPLPFTHLHYIV